MLSLRYFMRMPFKLKKMGCILVCGIIFSVSCVSEKKMGLGIEALIGNLYPFGGIGGGLSLRFKRVPIVTGVSCVYFDEQQWMFKITTDYWLLIKPLNEVGAKAVFSWFAGLGVWANCALYNAELYVDDELVHKRGVGGGFGMRMPIGGFVFVKNKLIEPYTQISPECGVAFYPDALKKHTTVVWALPISFGCRFWF